MRKETASSTALLIAAAMVMLHEDKNTCGLVSTVSADLSARFLQTQSFGTRLGLKIVRQSWFRPIASLIEGATIPGMLRHYALRKKVLRQMAQEALGDGIKQLVVLGAGFDTLIFELSQEYDAVRFWEIDHPATQMQKTRCLTSTENVRFVSADLNDNAFPATALKTAGFDPAQATLWIAEGLLMYFRGDAVQALIDSIRQLSAPGSVFAFTFMKTETDQRVRFQKQTWLADWWLRWRGEPFLWGSSREGINKMLQSWRDVAFVEEYDPVCGGEIICRAQL